MTRATTARADDTLRAGAAPILATCVHYGFCTATCPTYVLTRDENDGPRGRIDLIRAMLASDAPPDAKTVHHLDRCLSCLGCTTTCAVKVDYLHLIDIARTHIEATYVRPLAERLGRAMIAATIPHPARMRAALTLARLAKPFRALLPATLRAMVDMAPPADEIDGGLTRPAVHPAEGERRRRVALLPGCAQQALDRNVNAATIRLLTRLGCEVVVPEGLGCCGALTLHMGRTDDGKGFARRVVAALMREQAAGGLDAVVVNASGCGTVVKDYGHLFADEAALAGPAAEVSRLCRDVSELVAELGLPERVEKRGYRVTYHDACSLRHGQKVTAPPRRLLREAGYVVADVPEGHMCCGSAGVYNILQPELAEALGRRKAGHVASTDPDIVAMGNIGCLTQLRRYADAPAVHTVELIDWATGGPMPARLAGRTLRPPAPPAAEAGPAAAAEPPASFW